MRASSILHKYTKLSTESISKLIDRKWRLVDDRLVKKYALPSHTAAGDFVFHLAKVSDKLNHHPQIFVKYRFVSVYLRTNDVGALTDLDERLANLSDELKKICASKYVRED